MSTARVAFMAGVLAILAPPVLAQVEFEVTPFGGGALFLSDPPSQFRLGNTAGNPFIVNGATFDDTWTVGMNVGLRVNEDWAVEGLFAWIPTELSATSGLAGKESVHGYMYGVTALRYFPVSTTVQPFFGVGVGGETFVYERTDFETHNELMGNVVVGLFVPVAEAVGVRVEARDCFARFNSGLASVDSSWENDLMLTVGLSFRTELAR